MADRGRENGAAVVEPGGDGLIRVRGDMVFSTAGSLLEQGDALIAGEGPLVVDLSGVRKCDSAALALLLEWLERARRRGTDIRYRHLPDALRGIARLSNVEALLPLADA